MPRQREAHVWTLKSLMDGWVQLFNAQALP